MSRTIVMKKRFRDWSPNTQEQLLKLTYGADGEMCHTVDCHPELMTFVCWCNGEILGWSLYIGKDIHGYREAWFFVRPTNRRQGVASMIMTRVLKYRQSVGVYPGDYKSKAFFKKMRIKFGAKKVVY